MSIPKHEYLALAVLAEVCILVAKNEVKLPQHTQGGPWIIELQRLLHPPVSLGRGGPFSGAIPLRLRG